MTEITHLVVNGCSWTYGQGLEDPATQAWPALVAKELGIPVVNLAVRGSGNDSIHRRTYEYIYENLPTGSKPFVIIAWSQPWRREAWYERDDRNNLLQDYRGVPHPAGEYPTDNDLYKNAVIPHWNEEDFLKKSLLYKVSLQNLFKAMDIPYLMTDYSHDMSTTEFTKFIHTKKCKQMYIAAYNRFHIDSFPTKIKQFTPLPCLHDGPEAQKVLAEYTLSEIQRLFGEFTIKLNTDYLPIDKFVIQKNTPLNDWQIAAKNNR